MNQSSLSKIRECLQEFCKENCIDVKIKIKKHGKNTEYIALYFIEVFDACPDVLQKILNFVASIKFDRTPTMYRPNEGILWHPENFYVVKKSFSKKIEKKAINFLKKKFQILASPYPTWERLVFQFLCGNIRIGDNEHLLNEFWQEIEQKKGNSRNGK